MYSPLKIQVKNFADPSIEITFEQFISGDPREVQIKVLSAQTEILEHVTYKIEIKSSFFQTFYSYKRYSEFDALYQALKIKYKHIELPPFPSKFQLINKTSKRISGFQQLLEKIMDISINDASMKEGLFQILFSFLMKKTVNKYFEKNENQLSTSFISNKSMLDLNENQQNMLDYEDSKEVLRKHSFQLTSNLIEKTPTFSFGFSKNIIEKENFEKKSLEMCESQSSTKNKTENTSEIKESDSNTKLNENIKKNKSSIFQQISDFFSELVFSNETKERRDSIESPVKGQEEEVMKLSDYSKFSQYLFILKFVTISYELKENDFEIQIPIFNMSFEIVKTKSGNFIIEMWHKYDRDKIGVKILVDKMKEPSLKEKKIKEIYYCLKMASLNSQDLNLKSFPFKTIGKIYLEICEAKNLEFLDNSTLLLKIKHRPYTFETMKVVSKDQPKWNQKFLIPITNYYFDINFEIYKCFDDGWISESLKEELIGTYSFNVSDILCKFSKKEKIVIITFDLCDNIKTGNLKENPSISIKIQNLSHFSTCFAPQLENYIEGTRIDYENVDKKEFKINFNRFNRIVSLFNLAIAETDALFNFKYPRFSYMSWLVSMLFLSMFDFNEIFNYFLIFLIVSMTYYSPLCKKHINKFFMDYFFNENLINRSYIVAKIETMDEIENRKFADINRFKGKLKSTKRGLIDKILLMKTSLAKLQICLTYFCNFVEKVTNLITWTEPQKTLNFYLFLIFCFFFTVRFPFRLFFIITICFKFFSGRNYFKEHFNKNLKICSIVIEYIFLQHFPENISYFRNKKEVFPKNEMFDALKKKICLNLREILSINIDQGFIVHFECIKDLILMISTSSSSLKINKSFKNTTMKILLSKNEIPKYRKRVIIFKKILNYIYNIPSDYFRILHPKKILL